MCSRTRVVQTFFLVGVFSAIVILTGCSYNAAVRKLPPQEQSEFRAYSKQMSPRQERTYLAKPSPGARAAYLEQIGIAQRFAALAPEDRESVLAGYVRIGMSADALRFLWGEPDYIVGHTDHYEWWYYYGPAIDLVDASGIFGDISTYTQVYLIDGHLKWWIERVPESNDGDNSDNMFRQ